MWIYLGLLSALFLGCYDISKKFGVQNNAVLPVLFLSTVFGFMIMIPLLIGTAVAPDFMNHYGVLVSEISWGHHLKIAVKSLIIALAWSLNFFALKHLPITIVTPIRASGPLVTLLGAAIIFGEEPSVQQGIGLLFILGSFFAMSSLGKKEGINFWNNIWIAAVIVGTFLGACSGLYDKYLIQLTGIPPQVVQVWFSFYLVVILGVVVVLVWCPRRKNSTPFKWRWSIPLIGVLLIIADFFYFRALAQDDALIMILSGIKRSRVFVTLIVGGIIFKELHKKKKLIALTGVFLGVVLIVTS